LVGKKLHGDSTGRIQRPVAFCPTLPDGLAFLFFNTTIDEFEIKTLL
jgi:hypothetical protein